MTPFKGDTLCIRNEVKNLPSVLLFFSAWSVLFRYSHGQEHREINGRSKDFDMKSHHGPFLVIWRNPQMVQNLELTENQVKLIRDTCFAFREKHLVLKAQLDRFHLQLDKAVSSDRIDDTAVLKIAQEISDIMGKLFVQNVESRLALGKILTADQIKKMNLYDMQPKRKGPEQDRKQRMQDGKDNYDETCL